MLKDKRKKYMTSKLVTCKETTFNKHQEKYGYPVRAENDYPIMEIEYEDGYISHCPLEKFLENAIEVTDEGFVMKRIVDEWTSVYEAKIEIVFEKPTTIVHFKLPNGFIITHSTTCVNPDNYNKKVGIDICKKRAENDVWKLLGFQLSSATHGINKKNRSDLK